MSLACGQSPGKIWRYFTNFRLTGIQHSVQVTSRQGYERDNDLIKITSNILSTCLLGICPIVPSVNPDDPVYLEKMRGMIIL